MSENKKPYFDGSGIEKVALTISGKSIVVKPEGNIPAVQDLDNKPPYYDGSGKVNF